MGDQAIKVILPDELLGLVLRFKSDGYRLVAISCTDKDGAELSYSFDKEYEMQNLRFNISYDTDIESISCIYPYAFLYENEIKELFGVNIKNIALDFKNALYKTSEKTPFQKKEGQ